MTLPPLSLIVTGFLLGWSVAWPPGPINAEIARRCVAGGFWAGFSVLLGACCADAFWAILVSVGVGVLFTGSLMRDIMGAISIALLIALALIFLRGAWRAFNGEATPAAPSRFDSRKAGFFLGAGMALASPWNVAFWLAAMGRPELSGYGVGALLVMAVAVMAGALAWGALWSALVVYARQRGGPAGGRWWAVGIDLATALLMAYFAVNSVLRLIAG